MTRAMFSGTSISTSDDKCGELAIAKGTPDEELDDELLATAEDDGSGTSGMATVLSSPGTMNAAETCGGGTLAESSGSWPRSMMAASSSSSPSIDDDDVGW